MRKKEFEIILRESEGLNLEFKESFDSKNLFIEIIAFANSKGAECLEKKEVIEIIKMMKYIKLSVVKNEK